MTRAGPRRAVLAAAALLGGCAASAEPAPREMTIGVATHFAQGWPIALLDAVKQVGVTSIRDDLPWNMAETRGGARGSYDFAAPRLSYVRAACAKGFTVLLMLDPRNDGYDDGYSAHSDEAQGAFADYINAVLDAFGTKCVTAIEIGNEINGGGLKLPPGMNAPATYTRLLATIDQVVRPRHPDIRILGGSTNMIATGYLETLFAAGALDHVDGVVVHPYRDHPEAVDGELRRLNAAMRRHGKVKPVWATEFGDEVTDPAASPGILLRMLCLLQGEGVEGAYWYVLRDEAGLPNMGLFDPAHRIKPAGEGMASAMRLLAGRGRAVRIETGDRRSFVYRFGKDVWVIWGAPRGISFTGKPRFIDAQGRAMAAASTLAAEPVIVIGGAAARLSPGTVLADSLYDYGGAPWSYFARSAKGQLTPLTTIDWEWTSYLGGAGLRPLAIASATAVAAGNAATPIAPVWRYTAAASGPVRVTACFTKKREGEGLDISIRHNDAPLLSETLRDRLAVPDLPLTMAAGDTLDFAVAPHGSGGGDALDLRIRLARPGLAPLACA